MSNNGSAFALATVVTLAALLSAQAPAAVDTSRIGPQVGVAAPEFSGTDQSGRTQTLASTLGPNGAMLVFFRSADW